MFNFIFAICFVICIVLTMFCLFTFFNRLEKLEKTVDRLWEVICSLSRDISLASNSLEKLASEFGYKWEIAKKTPGRWVKDDEPKTESDVQNV